MNSKPTPILLFMLFFSVQLLAQTITQPIGASANALGGSALTAGNAFSTFNNPATLSHLTANSLAIYNSVPFTIKNLATAALAAGIKSNHANMGFGVVQFGYHAFNQQRFTLAAGKQLSNTLSVGVGLSALATHVAEQDAAWAFVGELGFLYKLNDKLTVAAYFFNPTRQKDLTYNQPTTSHVRAGLNYKVSNQLNTFFEIDKPFAFDLLYRAGILYQWHEYVIVKGGYQSWPASFCGGVNIPYKNWQFGFASQTHHILGITPSLSVLYNPQ